ncbi:MAG: rRNA maturation RNase YbeY [Rubricella sp.]
MTTIDLVIEDDRWEAIGLLPLAERAITAALKAGGIGDGYEIAILACDDDRIAALNAEFRSKPKPTNVLSWPAHDLAPVDPGGEPGKPPPPDGFDDHLGDIALAYETCMAEAREQGKKPADHVTHLILHGTLHLLGYDHIRDEDAELMEELERSTLAEMGITDPYSGVAEPS